VLECQSMELDNDAKKKLCPRCGAEGTGPYSRYVLNSRKRRYEPYKYFAHRVGGKIKWCYLGKQRGRER